MAGLNEINRPLFSGDDRYKMAFVYLDKLFPNLPRYERFMLHNIIALFLKGKEYREAIDLQDEIQDLLLNQLHYAERFQNTYQISLTELGRTIKDAGGHEAYLNQKTDREEPSNQPITSLNALDFAIIMQHRKEELMKNEIIPMPNNTVQSPKSVTEISREKRRFWPFIEKANTFWGATNGFIQFIIYLATAVGFLAVALNWKAIISFITRTPIK